MNGSPAFEVVIGLEVHVELNTATKMFCGCSAAFGADPNTNVCPVCLGLPGSLPVPNRGAVERAIKAALALHCQVQPHCKFDRKNYHYPDLPKNYQISQYDAPLARHGYVEVSVGGETRRIGIRRLHLEEDTGKSLHQGSAGGTLLDFNRAGVPLIEIVSEPDIRSPEEARLYLQELRLTLLYAGVSDVKMEEGSLRCDANISLRPAGSEAFGELVEIKNMNSFRSVQRALEFEAERQRALLLAGERVVRETRHWDEARGVTVPSRSKEEAHDYRYFPEPDLVPLVLDPAWVEALRAELPELPDARRRRYAGLGIPAEEAAQLVENPALAAFVDRALAAGAPPRGAVTWTLVELQGYLNETGASLDEVHLTPEHLAELLGLLADGTLSGRMAKEVFAVVCRTGQSPRRVVEEQGLVQVSDEAALLAVVESVLAQHPQAVADLRSGKEKAVGFLVGQVMRATRGQANPALANELVRRRALGG
ncbi:MAG: Asp-tRNA(Asn)/Glu-tRNA(Gln) amidotransferase subunit GatB [Clostridia bacterium]|nr:Asp-tRNA(Asn)/Glu-tRNA(Gln) amidotransferase subunit GatB [Clostridia bacterium]